MVTAAYGISWSYLLIDAGYAGYKAHQVHQSALRSGAPPQHAEATTVGLVVARRAVFQTLASMALPAFTIHSIVRYSAPLFSRIKGQSKTAVRLRGSGPTIAGLAFVPLLPFLFDHPVEYVVDHVFDWAEAQAFGSSVGGGAAHHGAGGHDMTVGEAAQKVESGAKELGSNIKDAAGKLLPSSSSSSSSASVTTSVDSSSLIAKAAMVGVGVDLLYLPRLRSMLHRHAQRLASSSSSGTSSTGRSRLLGMARDFNGNVDQALARFLLPSTALAGMHLAQRIGSETEQRQFRQRFLMPFSPSSSCSSTSAPRGGNRKEAEGFAMRANQALSEQGLRWLALR